MRLTAAKNVSAIALLAALAVIPFTEAHAQSSNASERGQEMGQGTPGGSNPNAGPGNNSGQGNTTPGSTGAARSGNDNAGPGNNSGDGSTQTPGPESGHNCGGMGHIDNDAPGHQHDDCDPIAGPAGGAPAANTAAGGAEGTNQNASSGAAPVGGAPAANTAAGGAEGTNQNAPSGAAPVGGAPVANTAAGGAQPPRGATPAGGGGTAAAGTTADCSLTANLTPLFGNLTQAEVQILATTDRAALVPVICPEIASDPEAQEAVAANPNLVRALEAQGYGVHQVITAEVDETVPTIYVEAESDN